MGRIVFIGDEVTGAGFRLAGAELADPAPERLAETVRAERRRADMLLITTEAARHLPRALYEDMLVWTRPLVAVLPDIRGREGPLPLDRAVRRELGIEV